MPRQKYEQIYSILKGQIEAGDYPVGGLLPSENVLIGEFQCSRNTVRRALANLVRDGYVQTRQGWGVCNIYQPIETSAYTMGTIESFAETARRTGQNSATRVVLFTTCTADEALSRRTGFPPGTELFYLQRVHDLDGVPRIFNRYLEQEVHMSIVTSKRTITVEMADELDRTWLILDGFNCLAVVSSQTYNSDGIMFEYTQSRHHPSIFRFQDNAVRTAARPPAEPGPAGEVF